MEAWPGVEVVLAIVAAWTTMLIKANVVVPLGVLAIAVVEVPVPSSKA